MEHCVHSLKKLIDTKVRLPEKQIRKIMRHICLGLKELHSKNIVHLDIKPGLN
jgi:serine/threonine protein kinase